jgi:predicted PurR-regulated permease PerM
MYKNIIIPFYAKACIIIVGIFVLFSILYIAQDIFIPIVFAIIISIVLHPIVNFFVRIKVNRVIAIIITITLTFLIFAGIGTIIISQATNFIESWPTLVDKITNLLNSTITNLATYFDVKPQYIYDWIGHAKDEFLNLNNNNSTIGHAIMAMGGWIMVMFLIPVYVFILLFYHALFIEFIHKLFDLSNQKQVTEIITQIKTVIQRYLIGLFIEIIIVSALDALALLALGIEYAFLLGIIGGLLNVIPYIGGIVAIALPIIIGLVTLSSGWYIVYIFVFYSIIQLIDNNIIVPLIVASKVKINALFSIVIVIAGNSLWGISGMFLSIPLLGILKVIFDHIDSLKPWGFLLGDSIPKKSKIKLLKM